MWPAPYCYKIDVWGFTSAILSWAANFSTSKDFLLQVLTFEGIILTVAVPLSLDMVSRVSERYQSNVVTKRFRSSGAVILLPFVLLFKVTAIIVGLFFIPDRGLTGILVILSWCVLISFLVIVALVIQYYRVLRQYMSEESSKIILQDLVADASKAIKK